MSDNFFDQFDAPAAPTASAAPQQAANSNFFDQFDAAPQTPEQGNAAADAAMASPEGAKLRGQLQDRSDKMVLNAAGLPDDASQPAYAALASGANTFGLNIPRNVGAAVRTLKPGAGTFDQEYDWLKRIDEAAARQNPTASTAGTVAGAVGQAALLPAASAETLAGRALQNAAGGAALEGATTLADTKDLGKSAKAMGYGALGGAAGGVIGEKVLEPLARAGGKWAGLIPKDPTVLSTPELKMAARRLYDDADKQQIWVDPTAVRGLHQDILQDLSQNSGFDPGANPAIAGYLKRLYNNTIPSATGVRSFTRLKDLETLRSNLGKDFLSSGTTDPAEANMARIIRGKIDDFYDNMGPQHVLSGDPQAATDFLNQARPLWQRAQKADDIDIAMKKAGLQAARTYTGGNLDNATRQTFSDILVKDLSNPGRWTPDEKDALNKVVSSDNLGNTLRFLGNKLSPRGIWGGAELSSAATALALGQPQVAAMLGVKMGVGEASRMGASAITQGHVNDLSNLVRSGGVRTPPPDPLSAARNLGVIGGATEAQPPPAPVTPQPFSPAAESVVRGGAGGATPRGQILPQTTTPVPPPGFDKNEFQQPLPQKLPTHQSFVRNKATGEMRIFDRAAGKFIGESMNK